MDKKSKIIVIGILVLNVIFWWSLVGLIIYGVSKFVQSNVEEYNFTSEKTYVVDPAGYMWYENEESGVSFYYPEDWIIVKDTVDEVYIANPYINEGVAGDIYYSKIDEEESLYTEEDYSDFKDNIMVNGRMQFDDGWYEGTNVERCLMVNNTKTFMWYNDMNPEGHPELRTYDLEYYSILEDDMVAYIRISSPQEDVFKTIAGTIIY